MIITVLHNYINNNNYHLYILKSSSSWKSKTLIVFFDHAIDDGGIYLICLKDLPEHPQVGHFIQWIKQQSKIFESEININNINIR